MTKHIVWSSGGGVQSTAIAVLIMSGRLPRPDLAVIADTGREASSTWSYLNDVVNPELRAFTQLEVQIASHSLATVDLYSSKGTLLIPAFTSKSGKPGQLPGYCSVEWKRRVVRRWLRQQGVKRCELWLGISMDEVGRAKPADVGWIEHKYPLIDLGLSRKDCIQIVKDYGLPTPPRSSCWMCPYRNGEEWAALTPGDMASAVEFDHQIRERDPQVYLSRTLKPLAEALPAAKEPSSLVGEVEGCDGGGYCWT